VAMDSTVARLIASLELKDSFSKGLKDAQKNLGVFEKRFGKTGAIAQRGIATAAGNLAKGATVLAAGTAGLVAASVKAAADYESAFAGVAKTVEATDQQLAGLSKTILDLSTQIPLSAVELAGLAEAAGALGVRTEDIAEFTRITALLGETTDLSAAEAADSLGVLTNVLGLTQDQIGRFGAALVDLGNNGASTESQIIQVAQRFGAAGKLAGLSTQDILGFSSAVASLGIEVEAGGSSLQNFTVNMTKMVAAGGKDLKLIAETAGVTAKAYKKAFEEDAGGALAEFVTGLGKLKQAEQLAVLEALGFGDIRITRTLLGLANNSELLNDQLGISARGWKENTALTTEAGKKFNTLSAQAQILKNSFTRAGIAVGKGLLKPLTEVAKIVSTSLTDPTVIARLERLGQTMGQALAAFVRQVGPKLPGIISDIADGFADVATYLSEIDVAGLIKSIPWDTIKKSMELTGRAASTILDTFLKMPPWVQQAVLTGWGLNKLTGGALGGIVGELGKVGIGKIGLNIFGGRGATPANPLFVAPVGGGLGGVPGGGAAASGKGAIASAVSFIIPAAALTAIAGAVVVGLKSGIANDLLKSVGLPTNWTDTELNKQSGDIVAQTQKTIAANKANTALLKSALGAVETGIAQIGTDPISVALYGQQLADLNASRTALEQAVKESQRTADAVTRTDHQQALQLENQKRLVKTASDQTNAAFRASAVNTAKQNAINATLSRVGEKIEGVKTAAKDTANVIRGKKWDVNVSVPVTVQANVSYRGVTTSARIFNLYTKNQPV
jgi:TP901 family phage tail tape measure protein